MASSKNRFAPETCACTVHTLGVRLSAHFSVVASAVRGDTGTIATRAATTGVPIGLPSPRGHATQPEIVSVTICNAHYASQSAPQVLAMVVVAQATLAAGEIAVIGAAARDTTRRSYAGAGDDAARAVVLHVHANQDELVHACIFDDSSLLTHGHRALAAFNAALISAFSLRTCARSSSRRSMLRALVLACS